MEAFERLFREKGQYDRIQLVVDYICEGQISKLFQVIDTHFKDADGAKGSILIQRNLKGQSLIHVLARNVHLMKVNEKGIGELVKFYKELKEQGVPSSIADADNRGRNPLHFAVKGGNLEFLKFLVEEEKLDIKASVDFRGVNPVSQLLKGDRLLSANVDMLKYLIKKGGDINSLYEESLYQQVTGENIGQDVYKCTPIIHCIRHPAKDRSNIKVILKVLLELGADPCI